MITTGTVKFFKNERDFGFIVSDNEQIEVHFRGVDVIADAGFRPQRGDRVGFDLVHPREDPDRPFAKRVAGL
jgi:cold shock CspA family protein